MKEHRTSSVPVSASSHSPVFAPGVAGRVPMEIKMETAEAYKPQLAEWDWGNLPDDDGVQEKLNALLEDWLGEKRSRLLCQHGAEIMLEELARSLETGLHGAGPTGDGGITLDLVLFEGELIFKIDLVKAFLQDCDDLEFEGEGPTPPNFSRSFVASRLRALADQIEFDHPATAEAI